VTLGPARRYPAGPITPHGAWHILSDRVPQVALRSYDDSIVFNLMGGLAIADPTMPESVVLKDFKKFMSQWKVIDQKGASQDGVSFVDALYDPIEPTIELRAIGRDPAHLRAVVRDLVASVDAKLESELSVFTHYLGRWWVPCRWFRTLDNPLGHIQTGSQDLSLQVRADSGFWQSYPHTDQFRFVYAAVSDSFNFLTAQGDPITGWTLAYSGAGSGVLYTDGDQAISTLVGGRTVVARRTTFTATSDNTVITIELGGSVQPNWPPNTYVDVWARMNNSGTAGTDGIRWRMGQKTIKLSAFNGGTESVIREFNYIQGRPTEKFTFITGTGSTGGDPRTYKVLRNNALIQTIIESGTASLADSSHRKVGFGAAAVSGIVRPLGVRSWSAGDNNQVAQEGFVQRVNVGDQPMWDNFTCFGPGTFFLGNGPDNKDLVKFGPLLTNQIMQVRTDPRKRGVIDMTAIPPTQQEVDMFTTAKRDFLSFLFSANAVPTAPSATESIFGITPPQGNPYSLLDGRFNNPVPPRSPGNPVQAYHTKVKITGGNSDSQIIVAGTPLRRLPY
jgi:hypothetical protein